MDSYIAICLCILVGAFTLGLIIFSDGSMFETTIGASQSIMSNIQNAI